MMLHTTDTVMLHSHSMQWQWKIRVRIPVAHQSANQLPAIRPTRDRAVGPELIVGFCSWYFCVCVCCVLPILMRKLVIHLIVRVCIASTRARLRLYKEAPCQQSKELDSPAACGHATALLNSTRAFSQRTSAVGTSISLVYKYINIYEYTQTHIHSICRSQCDVFLVIAHRRATAHDVALIRHTTTHSHTEHRPHIIARNSFVRVTRALVLAVLLTIRWLVVVCDLKHEGKYEKRKQPHI